jgi:hypothetical protein
LWAKGGTIARIALLVSTAGLVLTGDVPLAILSIVFNKLHVDTAGIFGQMLTLVMIRPASFILLAMSLFYLWVYLRQAGYDGNRGIAGAISAGSESTVKTE